MKIDFYIYFHKRTVLQRPPEIKKFVQVMYDSKVASAIFTNSWIFKLHVKIQMKDWGLRIFLSSERHVEIL